MNNLKSTRQSHMELLRIIAMFLVLLYHSVFLRNGLPTHQDVFSTPVENFFNLFLFALSAVCVNVFVLISGWFGIHRKSTGFYAFLFQILFYFLLGDMVGICTGTLTLNGKVLFNLLTFSTEYWFVYAYLGLYILAPVLNAYIENTSARSLATTIALFYALQTWYGWFRPQEAPFFYGGHSTLSFIGLYLVARYLHLYPLLPSWKARHFLGIFSVTTLLSAFLGFSMLYTNTAPHYAPILFQYVSPFVLLSALSLFLAFTRLHLHYLPWLNRIALSAFAVYLLHTHEAFYPYMEKGIRALQQADYAYSLYLLLLFLTLLLIYLLCTLIDQIRLAVWKQLHRTH